MHPDTLAQLERLEIEAGRPLLVSDADEVLFRFVDAFVGHIGGKGLEFNWSSFRLTGNLRRVSDGHVPSQKEVEALLGEFFDLRTATIPPVPGAAEGLARLQAAGAAIVVLTNIPARRRGDRARALARHAMDYPVVANAGEKGPAVAWLAERAAAPVVFVDDGPNHHASVKALAPDVTCLHYVATARLAALADKPDAADGAADSWDDLERAIAGALGLTCGGR